MATTSGNDRTQQRNIEPRRGETAGQDVTSRQTEQRGITPTGTGRRGLGGYGHGGMSSPFGMMRRLMEDMDRMFTPFGAVGGGLLGAGPSGGMGGLGGGMGLWQPPIELFEKDGNIIVRADLPGVQRDQVQLRLEDDVLLVSGERRDERKEEREGYVHSERSYGSFQRAIQLPTGVDPEKVVASFENGVLEVRVPVPAPTPRGRSIAIGEGKGGIGAKGLEAQGVATGDASTKARGMS